MFKWIKTKSLEVFSGNKEWNIVDHWIDLIVDIGSLDFF